MEKSELAQTKNTKEKSNKKRPHSDTEDEGDDEGLISMMRASSETFIKLLLYELGSPSDQDNIWRLYKRVLKLPHLIDGYLPYRMFDGRIPRGALQVRPILLIKQDKTSVPLRSGDAYCVVKTTGSTGLSYTHLGSGFFMTCSPSSYCGHEILRYQVTSNPEPCFSSQEPHIAIVRKTPLKPQRLAKHYEAGLVSFDCLDETAKKRVKRHD